MAGVCADFGAVTTEFHGQDNHVHPLVEYPPKIAVSTPVNSLKGVSTRRLRSAHTGQINRYSIRGHFWSPSYLATSACGTPLALLREHIDGQQQPAATR